MVGHIEDYGLIGDLQTAALVGRDGSIDWLCLPRFDSASCFAALVSDDAAGRWLLAPEGAGDCTRRAYRGDTLVLDSVWDTPDGSVQVTDLMPPRGGEADLVRVVTGLAGRIRVRSELRLRFDYGRVVPWLDVDGTTAGAIAGPDAVHLHGTVPLERRDGDVLASFDVAAGETVAFVLTHRPSWEPEPVPVDPHAALDETVRFWTQWIGQVRYDGPWAAEVRRSLVLLKALTDSVTGGIVAAATTSLPEDPGGVRNWDYRYCWLRDSAFTLEALLGSGFRDEARAWRAWLLRAVAGDPAELQIMYALDGSRRIPETEAHWLAGHHGARPVRIGNAAAGQWQLDVLGEVLDTLHLARAAGLGLSADAWAVQTAMVEHIGRTWREPDNGLWEVRGPRRHVVHSKVLAWAGVDRMVRAVEAGADGPLERWRTLRDEIHAEVCARGYDARLGSFTQSYGSTAIDAALLLLPQVGFLPWDDPRVIGTVEAVGRELVVDGLVLRYRTDHPDGDGLPGDEGVFIACTFWYADALWEIGRRAEATAVFERALALRNDLGMLAEEHDTRSGHQLGNTPQAFSLVGLVNTARRMSGEPAAKREEG